MAAMNVNVEQGHGTIKAPASTDPEADAGVLRKAMKGLGIVYTCKVITNSLNDGDTNNQTSMPRRS